MDNYLKIGLPLGGVTIMALFVFPGFKPGDPDKPLQLTTTSTTVNPWSTPIPPPTPEPPHTSNPINKMPETEGPKSEPSEPKKIVCYHTDWSGTRKGLANFTPLNINPYLCTHLIYAYASLDVHGNTLQPLDPKQDIELGGYKNFIGLKKYNSNLKTMIGVGGWIAKAAGFSNLTASKESRAAFVENVVTFLRQHNFDGLDVNWKYPNSSEGGRSKDKENYVLLIQELREAFDKYSSETGGPRLLLSMEIPFQIGIINEGYDVPNLIRYVDFMNVLTYEYHTASEKRISHHAPLYSLREESENNIDSQLTINYTINYHLKKGADPKKLLVSIPLYGRSYTLSDPSSTDIGSLASDRGDAGSSTDQKGSLSYFEICENVIYGNWKQVQPKPGSLGPYAFHENQWVAYDDPLIVQEKAKYVNEKGLGGLMFWTIDYDDFRGKCYGKGYPIIEAAKKALFSGYSGSPTVVQSLTREKLAKPINTTPKPASTTSKSTTTSSTFNFLSTPESPPTPDPPMDEINPTSTTPQSTTASKSFNLRSTSKTQTTPGLRSGASTASSISVNIEQRMKDMVRFSAPRKPVSGRPPNSHHNVTKN